MKEKFEKELREKNSSRMNIKTDRRIQKVRKRFENSASTSEFWILIESINQMKTITILRGKFLGKE
jgi:hypothetical protein